MDERIRFINHQGKQILFVDFSNCPAKDVAEELLRKRTLSADEVAKLGASAIVGRVMICHLPLSERDCVIRAR